MIKSEGGDPPCLMCAIRDRRVGETIVLHEDDEQIVLLPRYVRRWGHVLAMPKAHVTAYADIDEEVWMRTARLAHHAACVVEAEMRPIRCYQASTGSAAGELTQTSAHLHIHVIPLYDADDRPADVFSWADGIWVADSAEWEDLRRRYHARWTLIAGSRIGR